MSADRKPGRTPITADVIKTVPPDSHYEHYCLRGIMIRQCPHCRFIGHQLQPINNEPIARPVRTKSVHL